MPKINLGKVVGDKGEPFTFNDFTTEQLDGITPKILKGNVTTLDPDENAIVDIRKDGINNYIDFGIPRGKNGSELKDVSSENVVMADKTTLESTMTTVNENVSANSDEINKIKSPTFNDTVSTYSTLNDANTAAETTSNAIKSKVSIFTTLSNIKKSFSAIVQGLKILGTNVGAITGITSDLAGESETVAASIKAVNALNSKLDMQSVCEIGTGYMRFGNGFQICYGKNSKTNLAINVPFGNVYRNASVTEISYSKPFKTIESLVISQDYSNGGGYSVSASQTVNGFSYYNVEGNSGTYNESTSYIAVGTWK